MVIDTIVRGRAYGGLRITPDVTESEIRTLARTMTLKYGFLGLPFGGAKAGVRAEPEESAAQRQAQLTEFASAIQPLLRSRTYVPVPDMGTEISDIRYMLESVGLEVKSRQLRVRRSGEYTALTVASAARAAANWIGTSISDMTAAIEDFCKVGTAPQSKLARVLLPKSRLLLTLDSPAIPEVFSRQRLLAWLVTNLRADTFPLGVTAGPLTMEGFAEECGLQLEGSQYLLHSLRYPLVRVSNWLASLHRRNWNRVLENLILFSERLVALPARSITGHYMAWTVNKPSRSKTSRNLKPARVGEMNAQIP